MSDKPNTNSGSKLKGQAKDKKFVNKSSISTHNHPEKNEKIKQKNTILK